MELGGEMALEGRELTEIGVQPALMSSEAHPRSRLLEMVFLTVLVDYSRELSPLEIFLHPRR